MGTFKEKNTNLTDPYVTAGNRVYIIGSQDGLFPDNGGHVPSEMGGVWSHPIKLLDGFFIGLRNEVGTRWPQATAFRAYPFYTEHVYQVSSVHPVAPDMAAADNSCGSDTELTMVRRQFVPDDEELAFVTLEFTNNGPARRHFEVLVAVKSDLRPGWLGTEIDGKDAVNCNSDSLVFSDSENPWAVAVGTNHAERGYAADRALETGVLAVSGNEGCPFDTVGNGVFGTLILPVSIQTGETVSILLAISGSQTGAEDALTRLPSGLQRFEALWDAKKERVQHLDDTSHVRVPDEDINDTVRWVKFNTDWLVRSVPHIGNGLGAGLPEYPWWFGCDNGYALQGVLAAGGFELAKDTLRLLATVSERVNGNGRIIHELSATNIVFNPGNTQETPQFCMTVWDVFTWTGDRAFLEEMFPFVKKAIEWTLSMAVDGDDLAAGYGIMEVENLNAKLIDTAVYTQQALLAYAQMSSLLGHQSEAEQANQRAEKLKDTLLQRYWLNDEGLYADVLVDGQGMNQHLTRWADKMAAEGHDRAVAEYRSMIDPDATGERPYLLKNWVISTPVEMGIAPKEQAHRQLARMRTTEFKGKSGLYLSGIDRTHMMTISTSVQAVAECRYGYIDEALTWIRQIAGTRDIRTPGSISEMSPDYGCFVQAWTIYGVMVPIIRFMFGVEPAAHLNRCRLNVQMPSGWNEAELDNLRIGDNHISIQYKRTDEGRFLFLQSTMDWEFEFPDAVTVLDSTGHSRSIGTTCVVKANSPVNVRL